MKHKFEIVIEKPRDAVAALYADRPRIEEWLPGLVEYRHLSGEPGQPGAKVELVLKLLTVVEMVTDRNLPDSFSHSVEWRKYCIPIENIFEELSPSSTKWTLEAEIKGWIIERILRGREEEFKSKYMEPFKKFAEAEL